MSTTTIPGGTPVPTAPELRSDLAQESLVNAVRASFWILRLILIILLVAYVGSGVFQVGPDEQGLIVRFGKFREAGDGRTVFSPGWHGAWPDPLEQKIRLSSKSQRLQIDTFLFEVSEADRKAQTEFNELIAPRSALRPGRDGAMLTGDQNLAHARWEIDYRLEDARLFVENIGDNFDDAVTVLKPLAEAAVVREVGYRTFDDVIKGGASDLSRDVESRLARDLNELNTGLRIVKVILRTKIPGQVNEAYQQVTQAQNDAEREEKLAEKEAEQILNGAAGARHEALQEAIEAYGNEQDKSEPDPARLGELRADIYAKLHEADSGQVAERLGKAESIASIHREQIRSELEQFNYYHEQYLNDPAVVLTRRWVELRRKVMTNFENELFYLPSYGDLEILTNRDQQKAIDAEKRRYQKKFQR